jgi:hypothetical protein
VKQSNIKPLKTSRHFPMCIVEHTPVGIDKDVVSFGDLFPQGRCRRVVREVLGTVFEGESFVGSTIMSVSTYITFDSAVGRWRASVLFLPVD